MGQSDQYSEKKLEKLIQIGWDVGLRNERLQSCCYDYTQGITENTFKELKEDMISTKDKIWFSTVT